MSLFQNANYQFENYAIIRFQNSIHLALKSEQCFAVIKTKGKTKEEKEIQKKKQ